MRRFKLRSARGVSFEYPVEWTVDKPTDPRIKTGAKVLETSGREMAEVNFNTVFDFQPCPPIPYQLLDSTTVTLPGTDTSAAPTTIKTELLDIRAQSSYWPDKKPVRPPSAFSRISTDRKRMENPAHKRDTDRRCG